MFEYEKSSPNSDDAVSPSGLNEFLHFGTFVVPELIKVLYWVGVGLLIVAPLIRYLSRPTDVFGSHDMVSEIVYGAFYFVGANLVWRILCEFIIVVFRIYQSLHDSQKCLEQIESHLNRSNNSTQ
jgi:hypothetical protein